MGRPFSHVLNVHEDGLTLDEITFDPCGLIRLQGWSPEDWGGIAVPQLAVNGAALPLLDKWRRSRPDVRRLGVFKLKGTPGVVFEWLAPDGAITKAELTTGRGRKIKIPAKVEVRRSDYAALFDCPDVLGRDNIYGSGLPCLTVDEQMRSYFPLLGKRVLDFGCGAGALVREMRRNGMEALGIEIDRPMLREHMLADAAPHVTLYGGGALPYADDQFDSVTAFEVIEHVADHKQALAEIARVAPRLVMSVPDMSVVPMLQQHNVVPWHLLESTHLNFFTSASLRRALTPHYASIDISRAGEIETNGTRYFISLLAVCDR